MIHIQKLPVDAAGSLTTVPGSINGVLGVCPGETVTLTCSHNTSGTVQTRWGISSGHFCVVVHDGSLPPCGVLNITMVSDNHQIESTLTSTATISSINDAVVQCLGGPFQTSPQIGNVTIRINGEALL